MGKEWAGAPAIDGATCADATKVPATTAPLGVASSVLVVRRFRAASRTRLRPGGLAADTTELGPPVPASGAVLRFLAPVWSVSARWRKGGDTMSDDPTPSKMLPASDKERDTVRAAASAGRASSSSEAPTEAKGPEVAVEAAPTDCMRSRFPNNAAKGFRDPPPSLAGESADRDGAVASEKEPRLARPGRDTSNPNRANAGGAAAASTGSSGPSGGGEGAPLPIGCPTDGGAAVSTPGCPALLMSGSTAPTSPTDIRVPRVPPSASSTKG